MSRTARPGRIRIIAGRWRGRFIEIADHAGLRPSPARVRETLFNWLAPEIQGARCLDLFAGSGALGIEALSRGAARVTFVESGAAAAASLREQLRRLDAAGDVECTPAQEFVEATDDRFDIVFADPPFALDAGAICAAIPGVLRPHGAFYLERAATDGLPALAWGQWQRRSRAGDVCFGLARVERRD